MPTAHLIFFPDPRELTDAEYEEAKSLGHLRPPAAPPSAGVAYPVTEMTQQGIATTDPPSADLDAPPDSSSDDTPGEATTATKPKPRRKES